MRALAFVTKPSARLRRPVVPFDAHAAKPRAAPNEPTCPNGTSSDSAPRARAPPRAARGPEHFDVPSAAERLAGTVAEILKRF